MATVAENLTRIQNAIGDIKDAIIAKGGTISSTDKIENLATKITNLPTSGSSTTPTTPSEDEEETYVPDKYTRIYFYPVNNNTYLKFKIYSETGDDVTIDWGDGTEVTVTPTELTLYEHKFTTFGKYIIKVSSNSIYCLKGHTSSSSTTTTTGACFASLNYVDIIECGTNCYIGDYFSTTNNFYTRKLKLNNTQVMIPTYFAYGLNSIKKIKIPNSVTVILLSAFRGCYSLLKIEIPSSVTGIGQYAFGFCYSLETVIWKSTQQYIQNGTFTGCPNLKLLDFTSATQVMRFGTSATSTTTGTSTYIQYNTDIKIIVPKTLFNSWKANTYWDRLKDNIYWKDTDGTYKNTKV